MQRARARPVQEQHAKRMSRPRLNVRISSRITARLVVIRKATPYPQAMDVKIVYGHDPFARPPATIVHSFENPRSA